MECFICRKKFGGLKTLILHFKKLHNIRTESFIRCCNCTQSFQGLFRFKRHVNRHHINTSNELPQVCENVQNLAPPVHKYSNNSGGAIWDGSQPSCSSVMNEPTLHRRNLELNDADPGGKEGKFLQQSMPQSSFKSAFDLKSFKEKISASVLRFSLSLHNQNNFSRKDVFFVQSLVTEHIVAPLIDVFQCFGISYLKESTD